MDFKEDKLMIALALCVVAFVIAQAVFFLVRAIKKAKKLGIEGSVIKNTVISSSLFTIAPAISIVATVLTIILLFNGTLGTGVLIPIGVVVSLIGAHLMFKKGIVK